MSFGLKDKRRNADGSALVADADPNTTAPPDDQVFKAPLRNGALNGAHTLYLTVVSSAGGATVAVEVFLEMPELTRGSPAAPTWHSLTGAAVVVTEDQIAQVAGLPPECRYFLQLTAPTGSPLIVGASVV